MRIALADVITYRHLLSPREAATLTLAIGREWDRERARHGDRGLPDTTHIELNDTGDISFTQLAPDSPVHGTLTLSAILGHLLGLDEQDAPPQHVPGGLLITIAGRLGPMELPSAREDGFRSALLRFADDDPAVLVRVFDRIVMAREATGAEAAQSRSAKVRRGPERRRQPPAIAALRRSVRELERQTFEARNGRTRVGRRGPAAIPVRRRAFIAVAASTGALLLAVVGFLLGSVSMRTPTSTQQFTQIPDAPPPVIQPVVTTPQPVTPVRKSVVGAKRTASARVVPARAPQQVRNQGRKKPATPPHVTFAGGSRGIAWSRPAR